MESDAIKHERPAEIMTIKVISGFAKMKNSLALGITMDNAAEREACSEIVSWVVGWRLIHITRSNPVTGGEVTILLLMLIVTASYWSFAQLRSNASSRLRLVEAALHRARALLWACVECS